ncbi:hypothetical protein SAMN06297422_12464 [Lachnospiraceae bacterium]|nr:hypothetical protein SAMN06297422_12464 [Lachnospiraceae bacterium]
MQKTNNNESKMQAFFKEDNPKTLMILNGFTALIWTFCVVLRLHEIIAYNQSTGASLYVQGGLALFYLGMTIGYACKYAKAKKLERGE